MFKCRAVVKDILTQCPETRDNDNLLILKVWAVQQPELRMNYVTFIDFSHLLLANKVFDPDKITRARRKWQETVGRLRGIKYYTRQGMSQEEAKRELRNW